MKDWKGYNKPPRDISYEEMNEYIKTLAQHIDKINPDEIVGIMRSGMPFAIFIAQMLGRKEVGCYYPDNNDLFLRNKDAKSLYFIDDNVLYGGTYLQLKELMSKLDKIWYFGAITLDSTCPLEKGTVTYGGITDFYVTKFPFIFKNMTYGIRSRDENGKD